MLTFSLRNNQQTCRGPLLSNHKRHNSRFFRCRHGEDQSVLAPRPRHLVHLVLLQRVGPEPPDTVAHVRVAQLAHKHRVLSRRDRYALQLCDDPHALCGGRGSYMQLAF